MPITKFSEIDYKNRILFNDRSFMRAPMGKAHWCERDFFDYLSCPKRIIRPRIYIGFDPEKKA
jgi:hypothetical protein